ncbi:MAG TPA: extracellular solute-binding protein [Chloroflexia bacterium]|nr:extracellular solute-binding protein [Chloroflexia bacterium]
MSSKGQKAQEEARSLTRRRFLKAGSTIIGSALVTPILAACGDSTATPATNSTTATASTISSTPAAAATTASTGATLPFAGRTLTVFVYSGLTEDTFRNVYGPAFEKATGAKLVLSPGWWDAAAKLQSSPDDQPPFDLVETDPTQGFPGIRQGLFQKLDTAKIPNAKSFAPQILNSSIYSDSWGLPFISSAMTLCWQNELVPGGLKKWSDLFSDGLKGKIMLYNAYYMSLYTFAVAKVEMDGKPGTARQEMASNLDGVLKFARDKRDWVKYWWPTTADAANALLQKNVSAGNIHGNGLITPIKESKPVGFTVPQNDQAYVQLFFVVPKTTKQLDLAEAAINFFASEQIQRDFGLKTGNLSVNIPAIAQEVAPQQPVWAKVYPNQPDQFTNLSYYPYDVYDKNDDKITKFWNSEILRKS